MIFKRKRELLLCGSYLQLEAFFMTSTQGRVTFSNMSNKPPYFCWKRGCRKTKIVRGLLGERSLQKILAERHFCPIPRSSKFLFHQIFQVRGSTIVFCLIQIPVPFRYPIKVMSAGTDDKLLSQKIYFGDGGVYTAIIQPDPKKNDQVEFLFTE